jgi:endoglucanase
LLLKNNQAAINGIRSAGARQLILAPGNGFTGGHAWTQFSGAAGDAPSSDFLNKLVDPVKNTAMDIHEVRASLDVSHFFLLTSAVVFGLVSIS